MLIEGLFEDQVVSLDIAP